MTAEAIAQRLHARRAGKGKWQARCPSHKDRNPSLSVGEGKDGCVLLKCQAGCRTEAIVAAMGLHMRDLWPEAHAKKEGKPEARHYDYRDANGSLLYRVTRFPDKQFRQSQPDGKGGWIWNLDGVTRVPYRLPELSQANLVMIAEGEKDADTLAGLHLGKYPALEGRKVAATTNSGGAGKWEPRFGELLRGKDILVFEDNDEPGRRHAQAVLASVSQYARTAKLIRLPGLSEHDDVSDWMWNHKPDELIEEIQRSPLWTPEPDATLPDTKAESESSPLSEAEVQAGVCDIPGHYPNAEKVDILTGALETVNPHLRHRDRFYALCVALQRLRGNEPVVLPVERISAGFGCHWTLIARLRRQAVTDGWLKPERRAIAHRQAARFFVLSDTEPSYENEKEDLARKHFPQPRNHSQSHSHFSETLEPEPLVRHLSETPAGENGNFASGYEVIDI